MKAVAFSNNDMAVVAWTFGGKLKDCLGFAVHRIDVKAGTETPLPAMATFKDQQATPGRTTADDPVQKFFWKDVYAKRGGTYKYKIVPMSGQPGALQPMPFGPLVSNQVQLSAHYGTLSAYFNRGILATQATAHKLTDSSPAGSMVETAAHALGCAVIPGGTAPTEAQATAAAPRPSRSCADFAGPDPRCTFLPLRSGGSFFLRLHCRS